MPFLSALKNFSENGSFELINYQIFLKNIRQIENRIKYLKKNRADIPFYQIRLSNVQFIPDPLPRTKIPGPILSGTVVEQHARAWKERFTHVALTQMASINELDVPLNFTNQKKSPKKRQLAILKGALLSLLTQPDTWDWIELDHVFFHKDPQINYSITEYFYNNLLNSLDKNKFLKKLSIKPFSLTKCRHSLVNFLTQNTQLETLHLEINEANRDDWLELSQILAIHPKLSSFNLAHSILDDNAYFALKSLLNENYRIEITLPTPMNKILLETYEPLKQRLSKSNLDRFKEEDLLSQTKLTQVAVTAIESLHQLKPSPTDQIKESINDKEDETITADREKERIAFNKKLTKMEATLAETEAKQTKMEATLNKLLRQIDPNSAKSSKSSSLHQEKSEASTSFFTDP